MEIFFSDHSDNKKLIDKILVIDNEENIFKINVLVDNDIEINYDLFPIYEYVKILRFNIENMKRRTKELRKLKYIVFILQQRIKINLMS